ncbi:MAG: PAS domain S-box protein [Anaerolineae bacterium]|nr:PAS domain S-box protein [Anaerolineae bacterium]
MASTDIGTVFLDRHLHLKRFTPKACEIFNIITADLGRPFDHISHKLHYDSLSADIQQVLKSLSKIEREAQTKDDRWYVITILPYRTLHDKIDGVVLTSVDVTELKQVEKELKQRVLQQATVAQLGKMALAGTTLDELMDTATGCICEALEIELCKILELMPNHKDFLLKAGTGWQEGSVGQVHIPNNKNSQAGYTLVTHEPVIVENLPQETRFSGPEFLTEHDVISGMSVIIGDSEKPYGVLGAHSKKSRTFSRYDVNFILSVANILAEVLNRKQAEEALQLNREIIQHQLSEIEAIYTTAPVGLAFLDSELRFVRINERLAEINGLSVSDHLGHTPAEILPELDEIVNPYLQQAITGHSELNVELHGTTPAAPGVERDWLASYLPLKGPDNEVAGINTVIQEITETKRARKALEASEERFRRAVVEAPFPILAHAEDGEIVMISNVVTDLTGYTVEEIQTVEAWVKAVYPNEMQPQIKKGVENLYELTDRLDEGEFEITTKEGHKRIWHFHSAPLGTDEQGRRLVISMASDVTKRKEFEEALQKNQQRLKELNETLEQRVVERTEELTRIIQDLDQFAYVASHDLKTPLRAIDNLAAWITEDAADNLPEASKEHLEKMRDRVHRMETLLNDLLAYSRAGRDHEEIEEVDTGELVGNILTILALPKRFTVDVQPDMPHVRTNRPLLEMVLRNLIDNAIKHHDRSDGLITVSANRSGKDIVFSVTDDGPGIDPAFHTRIFQIFQTLQSKDKNGGSGVGLAIVKKIIEARGGSIEVESITGQGATFRFTWPGDQSLV